jgi:chromosome segregation ATPase
MPSPVEAPAAQRRAHNSRAKAITKLLKDSSVSAEALHKQLSDLREQLEEIAEAMALPRKPTPEAQNLGALLQALHELASQMTAHPPLTGVEWRDHQRRVNRTKPLIRRASASAQKLARQLNDMNEHWSTI